MGIPHRRHRGSADEGLMLYAGGLQGRNDFVLVRCEYFFDEAFACSEGERAKHLIHINPSMENGRFMWS